MQDFFNHFKSIFDLKLNSFFSFIDSYINAGNYEKKYGSFEGIGDYFKINEKLFTSDEHKPQQFKYRVSNKDFINIFEWNNERIIIDLKNVVIDLQKSKIDNIYLSKFISFMCEDLNNECQLFKSEDFELIKVKKAFQIENGASVNFLENSLRTLNTNKELIENLVIKFSEINKTEYLKFLNENENHLNIEIKETTNVRNKKLNKVQWTDTEESLIRLFDYLYNSGFINTGSYKNRFSLISNTFLNKEGKEFKNKQLSVTYQRVISEKISNNSDSHAKFEKLISILSKQLK